VPGPVEFLPLDPDELDGWTLVAEGALVHRSLRAAVIADVHLGYEWARGSGGDMVPAHSLRETIARLESLAQLLPIRSLIVAGDLVESAEACPRTLCDVSSLAKWLGDHEIELLAIEGNHDRGRATDLPLELHLGGWSIAHGHLPLGPGRWIIGHHHPAVRLEGVTAPCFLVHRRMVILPTFSANAAGRDVLTCGLPSGLREHDFRCVIPIDGRLLDFGSLQRLRAMFRAKPARG
jgi:putative SbcD/Mre11-related phosphoesterase